MQVCAKLRTGPLIASPLFILFLVATVILTITSAGGAYGASSGSSQIRSGSKPEFRLITAFAVIFSEFSRMGIV